MRTIFSFFLMVFFLFANPTWADSGGTLGDINCDGKIDLREVIYALEVSAGLRPEGRTLDPLQVYRADVIRFLKKTAIKQEYHMAEYNTYTEDVSIILPSETWPQIHINIISADNQDFQHKGIHEAVNGDYWTVNSYFLFEENGSALTPDLEIFELYREKVMEVLWLAGKNQSAYFAEYGYYTTDLGKLFDHPHFYPGVTLEVIQVLDTDFVMKGTHEKIQGYYWTFNAASEYKTHLE